MFLLMNFKEINNYKTFFTFFTCEYVDDDVVVVVVDVVFVFLVLRLLVIEVKFWWWVVGWGAKS